MKGLSYPTQSNYALSLDLPGHDPLHDRWVIDAPGDPSSADCLCLYPAYPWNDRGRCHHHRPSRWRHLGIGKCPVVQDYRACRATQPWFNPGFCKPQHSDAPAFLKKHGFVPQGAYTELRLAEGIQLPPIIWPFGYTMRTYREVQDLSILTQAMNLCYIPLWGHQEVSESEMASWLPNFNHDGLFLVFSEKGRVVGISRTEPSR